MESVTRCPHCLAACRPGDRFCAFCLCALEVDVPTEPPVEAPGGAAFTLPPPIETTGQAQVLAACTEAFGVEPVLLTSGLKHLHGIAMFTRPDEVVLVTLGFSEVGAALYAWELSGLGFELVVRVPGDELPDDLVSALEELRARQGTASLPPCGFDSSAFLGWFTESSVLERLDTINGAVHFFDATITRAPVAPTREEVEALRTRRVQQLVRATTRVSAPELEAAFTTRRDEASAEVLSDFLQQQGDAVGELAALVRRFEVLPDDWLEANQELVFGELRVDLDEHVRELDFLHGFLEGVTLRANSRALRYAERDTIALHLLTSQLLKSSFGRFVRKLRFGNPFEETWAETMAVVAAAPQAAHVTELRFDDYDFEDNELSWTAFGDFSQAWARLPSLEVLHLRAGGAGVLGRLELPRLRTFIRETGGLPAEQFDDVLAARWPNLEHLAVWTGREEYGAGVDVDRLERLFASPHLPSVRHFGLVNCEVVHEAVRVLARSKLLPRLRSLDLSRGVLNDDDVPMLLSLAPAFRHLELLDLSQNQLSAAGEAALGELGNVVLTDQREDAERYTAVGE